MNAKLLIVASTGLGQSEREAAEALGYEPTLRVVGSQPDAAVFAGVEAQAVLVAIDDNALRRAWCELAQRSGLALATLVHPRAWVSPSAQVGEGVWIGPGSHVTGLAQIGRGVRVAGGVSIEHHNAIGDWVRLDAAVALAGRVTVGEGAALREKACVRPGITVGAGAQVGVRAVVVKQVLDGVCVEGVPAREVGAAGPASPPR